MKRYIVALMIALTSISSLANCHGRFSLTRTWDGVVSGISNKWIRWLFFLLTVIIPIYGIAMLVDAIAFNSIEFWTGRNPMAHSDFDQNGELQKVVSKGDERAVLTYRNFGEELNIRVTKAGVETMNVTLLRSQPGAYFVEQDGKLVRLEGTLWQAGGSTLIRLSAGDETVSSAFVTDADYDAALNRGRAAQEMLAH